MGARKLSYHVPSIRGYNELSLKKITLFSKVDTGIFSVFYPKNRYDSSPLHSVHTEFGMLPCSEYSELPNRHGSSNEYRYGFNGMEKDDEVSGEGNSYDFGARIYDPRVGRWLSMDPKYKLQPGWSTYKAFYDNPIIYIDPEGEVEKITIVKVNQEAGEMTVTQQTSNKVMSKGTEIVWDNNACYHLENRYYDYETVIVQVTDKGGNIVNQYSSSVITGEKVKDSDYVLFNYQKVSKGATKDHGTPEVSTTGGIIIWGESSNNSDSPGEKTTGKIYGHFDYGGFMKIMGLVLTSVKSQSNSTLGPKEINGVNIEKYLEKVRKYIKYEQEKKEEGADTESTEDDNSGTNGSSGGSGTKGGGVNTGNSSGESKNTSYDDKKNRFHMDKKGDTIYRYKNEGTLNKPKYQQNSPDLQPVKK